jgi:hypothetical protein
MYVIEERTKERKQNKQITSQKMTEREVIHFLFILSPGALQFLICVDDIFR